METIPIGSITVFVNTGSNELYISQELINIISQTIVDQLRTDLKIRCPKIIITEIKITRGCILIELVLALMSGGRIVYDYLKDLPDLLEGCNIVFNSLKGKFVKTKSVIQIEDNKSKMTTAQILIENSDLTKNFKKGDRLTVTETIVTETTHKVAIFRNDLSTSEEFFDRTETKNSIDINFND